MTEFNSVTCGGVETFAVDGVIDIADEMLSWVADLLACGSLLPADDTPATQAETPAEGQGERPTDGGDATPPRGRKARH